MEERSLLHKFAICFLLIAHSEADRRPISPRLLSTPYKLKDLLTKNHTATKPTQEIDNVDYLDGNPFEPIAPYENFAMELTDDPDFVEAVVSAVDNQTYDLIVEFKEVEPHQFFDALEPIIAMAYRKLGSAAKILGLTDHLDMVDDKLLVFEILWDVLYPLYPENVHDILTYACYLKNHLVESEAQGSMAQETGERFDALVFELPKVVRAMFFETVCISNFHYNEFLYTDRLRIDEQQHYIFTWRPRNEPKELEPQYHWKIENGNQCQTFSIKTNDEQYVYVEPSAGFTVHEQRQRVYTGLEQDEMAGAEWQLEYVKEGNIFKLKNVDNDEYLFAGKNSLAFDTKRRSVFSAKEPISTLYDMWRFGTCS